MFTPHPHPFLDSQDSCSDEDLLWILGSPDLLFFCIAFSLKNNTTPKGSSIIMFIGSHTIHFLHSVYIHMSAWNLRAP